MQIMIALLQGNHSNKQQLILCMMLFMVAIEIKHPGYGKPNSVLSAAIISHRIAQIVNFINGPCVGHIQGKHVAAGFNFKTCAKRV